MKIMIVDDNAEMRRLLMGLLRREGTEFIECADGAEAVPAFEVHHPDWTVMDIMMKDVDGITATQRIHDRHPNSRVVVVTQHDNPKLRAAALTAGACGFALKDDLDSLLQIIRQPD
jgi:two-component system response regulator DegU